MTRDELAAAGAKLSGGPIKGFEQGWAIIPFRRKPHFWIDHPPHSIGARFFKSLCGVEAITTEKLPALDVGEYVDERCKHCLRRAK